MGSGGAIAKPSGTWVAAHRIIFFLIALSLFLPAQDISATCTADYTGYCNTYAYLINENTSIIQVDSIGEVYDPYSQKPPYHPYIATFQFPIFKLKAGSTVVVWRFITERNLDTGHFTYGSPFTYSAPTDGLYFFTIDRYNHQDTYNDQCSNYPGTTVCTGEAFCSRPQEIVYRSLVFRYKEEIPLSWDYDYTSIFQGCADSGHQSGTGGIAVYRAKACVFITSFTGNRTTIDPEAGGRVTLTGEIANDSGQPISWTLTIAGRTYRGTTTTATSTWDGKDASGNVVEPGTYTATLKAETDDGSCTDTKTLLVTITVNPEDCKLNVSFGSTVSVASGNLNQGQTLFEIPGSRLMPDFTLTYNSTDSGNGHLGKGWTHSYNLRLVFNNNDTYTLANGSGGKAVLIKKGETYAPELSAFPVLTKNVNGTLLVTYKSGLKQTFTAAGRLLTIRDKNANTLTLAYTSGRLCAITDSSGRRITLAYNTSNRISGVTDPYGNSYSLSYNSISLSTVTQPDGGAWSYTYDAKGFMLTKTDPLGNTTTYTYDSLHRVKQATDPEGKTRVMTYAPGAGTTTITEKDGGVWTYLYDSDTRALTAKTDPLGNTTQYGYDSQRNLIAETAPDGGVTGYTYDSNGNVLTVTAPLGNITTYTYNHSKFDQVATVTDPQGYITRYTYDAKGNLATVTDPLGGVTQFGYDARGNVTSVIDSESHETTLTYDQYDNILTVTDPSGAITTYTSDAAGNMQTMTDPKGNTTTLEHNSLHQLLTVTDPVGNITQHTYDLKGNRTSTVDGKGNTTHYAYDYAGHITTVTDALNKTTIYAYGAAACPSCGGGVDKLTAVTDAVGNRTAYEYDTAGRLIKETDATGAVTAYTYDPAGNIATKTDGNGKITTYTHNLAGRLTQKIYPDGTKETYRYNKRGNLTYAGNKNIVYTITYDKKGRITTLKDTQGRTTTYGYDKADNRTRMITPEGDTITYGYDTASRLTQITEGTQTFGLTYDTAGRRTKLTLPNGTYTGYSYDADSRPSIIAHRNPASSLLERFVYAYDPVSNITAKTDLTGKHAYTYDKLSRLRKTLPPAADTTESPENYTFDPVGNRLTGPGATDAGTYSPGNLLASDSGNSYTYNSNGSLTQKTGGGVTAKYFSDAENRLIKATITGGKVITFTYDPFGRRIEKKVAITTGGTTTTTLHEYLYDNEDIILEYQSVNGGAPEVTKYLHGPGIDEPLAMERGGKIYCYHADYLGSIIALTDDTGAVAQKYDYDSYGNLDPGTTIQQPYAYTGREWDSETGLYYYRARYYDPKAGRFISKDPIGFKRGDVNLFRYVENNPVNWIDPLGLSSWRPVPGAPGWDVRHDNFPDPHDHYRHRGKERARKVLPDGSQSEHGDGEDKDVPQEVIDARNKKNRDKGSCSKGDAKSIATDAATVVGGYAIYRLIRMVPSLIPALWGTIPINIATP